MPTFLDNKLDQRLDILGTVNQSSTRTLTDETSLFGATVPGQTGAAASVSAFAGGISTLTGLTGMTAQSVGHFLTVTGAASPGNNGSFLIVNFTSSSSVDVANAAGVSPDANNGAISWTERLTYALEDNIQFEQTDRTAIKGVNYDQTVAPYFRPTATATPVATNLTTMSGKTTDAMALTTTRKFPAGTVAQGDTSNLITSVGNLQHATTTDRTGVPVNDGADAGANEAVYVEVIDPDSEAALEVNGRAVGSITTIAGSLINNGEQFVLNDGVNPAVTFQFDNNNSVVPTNTLRDVPYTAGFTATQIRDAIITAVNGAPVLNIDADIGGASLVQLTNRTPGTAGNVAITTTVANAGFIVAGMSGGTADGGKRIFGRTLATGSTSPDSVTIEYRAVAKGADLSTSVAYTWERDQPTTVDYYYGFRQRLDLIDDAALRRTMVNGLVGNADLRQDISDIQTAVGITDGALSLAGLLTNTTSFYVFSELDADPTVVEALNILNADIGNRTYTGSFLTSGQTVTASLQALSNSISAAQVMRTIERLSADIPSNTPHTLPGGITYTLDGTNNGKHLWVFARHQLLDPGPSLNGNDYSETSTTSVTFYSTQRSGDHLNYVTVL